VPGCRKGRGLAPGVCNLRHPPPDWGHTSGLQGQQGGLFQRQGDARWNSAGAISTEGCALCDRHKLTGCSLHSWFGGLTLQPTTAKLSTAHLTAANVTSHGAISSEQQLHTHSPPFHCGNYMLCNTLPARKASLWMLRPTELQQGWSTSPSESPPTHNGATDALSPPQAWSSHALSAAPGATTSLSSCNSRNTAHNVDTPCQ
jgi:hypothetical protein